MNHFPTKGQLFSKKYGHFQKLLIFTPNPAIMKWIKLTAFTSLLFVFVSGISSCEKNSEKKIQTDYQKLGLPLTFAQESPTPPVFSSAIGSMDVSYSKETRTLSWSVTWSGLTGLVANMHIHGLGPRGYAAGVVQNIITASNGIATPGAAYGATGKISGTLLVDGVVVKELDLLNGMYYMNIHTAANTGGEIRGQIVFQ